MMLREKGQWIESGSVGRWGLGRKVTIFAPEVDRQREVTMDKTQETWPNKTKGNVKSAVQCYCVVSTTEQGGGWDTQGIGKSG